VPDGPSSFAPAMDTGSTRPPVSILVPSFNDAAHLDAALTSLAAQTVRSFEVVISDDASDDDSPRIAEAWATRDARFRACRSDRNLGMTENWNRALSESRGELVAKLDADDLWRPRALEELLHAIERSPDPWLSFCRAEVGDTALSNFVPWPGDEGLRRAGLEPTHDHVVRGRALWLQSLGDVQLWHSNAFLVERHELLRLGGFDERWSCASDTAMVLRLLAENRPVSHAAYVGVAYRRRAGSVSDTFERQGWKTLEGLLVRLDALARDGRRLGPLPQPARQAWWQCWRSWRGIARDANLWNSMPEGVRDKLRGVSATVSPPPLAIRLEGWLRLRAWMLRRGNGRARKRKENAA